MINIIKNVLGKIFNKNFDKKTKDEYSIYLEETQKDFQKIGIEMYIDANSNSYGIIFPSDLKRKLTIEDLSDELSNLSNISTDYLIQILAKYINVFSEYELSIILNENKCSSKYVYKTIFSESITSGIFVPVIGHKGIHTITKETLQCIGTIPKIFDYTVMLDNNIVSNAEKYFSNIIEISCKSFDHIKKQTVNFDPSPYLIEQLIIGYEKFGDNYRLDKNNEDIAGLVQNIRVIHKNLKFKIEDEEEYIDNFVKNLNKMASELFRYYNINKLSLIYILEARALFKTDQKLKRQLHVLESLTNNNLPIGFRVLKLMSLFFKDDNYAFFGKVRNFNNEEKFRDDLNNTSRDLLICTMPSIMNSSDLFPILYSDDKALHKAYKDLQPDLILNMGLFNRVSHIYLDILEEFPKNKKFKEFFTKDNHEKRIKSSKDSTILFSDIMLNAENNLIRLLKKDKLKSKK